MSKTHSRVSALFRGKPKSLWGNATKAERRAFVRQKSLWTRRPSVLNDLWNRILSARDPDAQIVLADVFTQRFFFEAVPQNSVLRPLIFRPLFADDGAKIAPEWRKAFPRWTPPLERHAMPREMEAQLDRLLKAKKGPAKLKQLEKAMEETERKSKALSDFWYKKVFSFRMMKEDRAQTGATYRHLLLNLQQKVNGNLFLLKKIILRKRKEMTTINHA